MDLSESLNEKLREAACIGDVQQVTKLLSSKDVDVNSKHKVNGWTALHWASKRGHAIIVSTLLNNFADKNIKNNNNQIPSSLAKDKSVLELLQPTEDNSTASKNIPVSEKESTKSFVPNYIKYPVFPYSESISLPNFSNNSDEEFKTTASNNRVCTPDIDENNTSKPSKLGSFYKITNIQFTPPSLWSPCGLLLIPDSFVFKVRINPCQYFTEVIFPRNHDTSFANFVAVSLRELNKTDLPIKNIIKLPDTIIKTDMDIKRLTDYQCIEINLL